MYRHTSRTGREPHYDQDRRGRKAYSPRDYDIRSRSRSPDQQWRGISPRQRDHRERPERQPNLNRSVFPPHSLGPSGSLDQTFKNALALSQASVNAVKYRMNQGEEFSTGLSLPLDRREPTRLLETDSGHFRERQLSRDQKDIGRSLDNSSYTLSGRMKNVSGESHSSQDGRDAWRSHLSERHLPPREMTNTNNNQSTSHTVGSTERPVPKRKRNRGARNHGSVCPVPGCNSTSRKLKMHMFDSHLPYIFKDKESESQLLDEGLHQRRADALNLLAQWILGRDQQVWGLVGLLNRSKLIPQESKILGSSIPAMRTLCQIQGWRVPKMFQLNPMNSPAALMHWRALAVLLKHLTDIQREVFRNLYQSKSSDSSTMRTGVQDSRSGREDMRSERQDMITGKQDIRSGGQGMRTGGQDMRTELDMRTGRQDMRTGGQDMRTGGQDMRSLDTGHRRRLALDKEEIVPIRNIHVPVSVVPEREFRAFSESEDRVLLGTIHREQDKDISYDVDGQPYVSHRIEPKPAIVRQAWKDDIDDSELPISLEVQAPLLDAFDCFYHVDKTALELWGSYSNVTTEKILLYGPQPALGYSVNLVGGVEVYSDPETYPEVIQSNSKWKVALGVHPLTGHLLTDEKFGKLLKLLATNDVAALGVIGLDRSAPSNTWIQQEKSFREVLKIAKDTQPIILHVRGQLNDPYASDVHARCLKLLQDVRPRNQPIHLHCFRGMKEQVVEWLTAFPNTYFGFTAKCLDFDEHQLQALRAVPANRIVIETNSPRKWPGLGSGVTTPAMIGSVAMIVATQSNNTSEDLLRFTTANAKHLYSV